MNKNLKSAREKISEGERLNFNEIIALYEENNLLYLAESARRIKERQIARCARFSAVAATRKPLHWRLTT